jgi:hypothetical protein
MGVSEFIACVSWLPQLGTMTAEFERFELWRMGDRMQEGANLTDSEHRGSLGLFATW